METDSSILPIPFLLLNHSDRAHRMALAMRYPGVT
jgi:hypothetical protein